MERLGRRAWLDEDEVVGRPADFGLWMDGTRGRASMRGMGTMLCRIRGMDKAQLLASIDEAYEKKAWHGPNLRGTLRGVTADEASWRPGEGRHNIWELTVHAAY